MKVCLGGTFDILHDGHKKLLDTAFQIAGPQGFVFIGVTTGRLATKGRQRTSFRQRKTTLETYLTQTYPPSQFCIESISDRYGPAVDGDYDVIVVSPETRPTAEEINQRRVQQGRKPLRIVQIPFVLAQDNLPLSSSRIRKGEIDVEGRILPH